MNTYDFPHKQYTTKLTPEFMAEWYPKLKSNAPWLIIGARSPGEAILKFQEYVEYGQFIGAYQEGEQW